MELKIDDQFDKLEALCRELEGLVRPIIERFAAEKGLIVVKESSDENDTFGDSSRYSLEIPSNHITLEFLSVSIEHVAL